MTPEQEALVDKAVAAFRKCSTSFLSLEAHQKEAPPQES
jgi:hypothetical protein